MCLCKDLICFEYDKALEGLDYIQYTKMYCFRISHIILQISYIVMSDS